MTAAARRQGSLQAAVLAAALVMALLAGPGPLRAEGFFAAIDDLPIADGLAEVEDEGVVFESPAGRIVTAVAAGSADAEAVRAFYAETLPALGWERTGPDAYRREGTTLNLKITAAGTRTELRFRLVPAAAKN